MQGLAAGRVLLSATLAVFVFSVQTGCHKPQPVVLTISVAASLTDAIQEIEISYAHGHPDVDVRNNLGSSGTLAREIEQGAPVDVFVSAASKPMDDLQTKGLLVPGSRRNLLRNTLVLIVPSGSRLNSFAELNGPSVRSIAVGDPASVPAGQYGLQTLTALHLSDSVRSRLVLAKDVRQVLAYVETGNADAGIVYATDAITTNSIRVVATAPEAAHDPIIYPAAAIVGGHHQASAHDFVDYLSSPAARAIFQKRGFTVTVQ